MQNVNKQLLDALGKISGMTVSMYTSAGEAMCDAKRIAHEAIAAAEQAQQAEPVAWLKYPRKKPELMQVSLSEHLPVVLKNSGWVSKPLYTQPPAVAVPQEAADSIRSPFNACCNKEYCRAMLAAQTTTKEQQK